MYRRKTRNYIYVQASIKKLYFMYWPTLRNYIYRGTGVHQKNYIYVQACFKKYIYVQDPSRNYTYVQAYIKKLYFYLQAYIKKLYLCTGVH